MADNMGTVAEIYEAFGRGDVASIIDQLDDDVSWDEGIRDTGVPYLLPGRGKQHVAAFFERAAQTLEFTQFDVGPLCDGGDVVMVPVRQAGRIIGAGEIAPNDEAHVWRFGPDGKVTSFRHIGDWSLHEGAAAESSAQYAGRTLEAIGDEIDVLQAGGTFEVFRVTGKAESGPPPHAHAWGESFYGLTGEVEVVVGADAITLAPGGFVEVPADTVHTFRVVSDSATFLTLTSGHRASAFFADIEASMPLGPPTEATLPILIDVARRNGLTSPLFD
jgi:quercetin dioxygenase-like cupin family protein